MASSLLGRISGSWRRRLRTPRGPALLRSWRVEFHRFLEEVFEPPAVALTSAVLPKRLCVCDVLQ
eukprot:11211869-Lingulodinium_polyedra.AAC.1